MATTKPADSFGDLLSGFGGLGGSVAPPQALQPDSAAAAEEAARMANGMYVHAPSMGFIIAFSADTKCTDLLT